MFWIIHLLVGMVIGLVLESLLIFNKTPEMTLVSTALAIFFVIILSFFSHFLVDMVPHWDGTFDRKGFVKSGKAKIKRSDIFIRGSDGIITIILFVAFYFINPSIFWVLGAFFSLLPDLVKVFYLTPLKNNRLYLKYLKFHGRIEGDAKIIPGLMIQLVTAIILSLIIFFIV